MDKIKVLLIDDEDDPRKTLAEYLELQADFAVVDYADGKKALEDLQRNKGEYTAVILDWVLTPTMSGEQALSQIRTSFPQLPVMVITGKAPAGGLDVMAHGAYQFLQRPINHTELINAIRNVARQDLIFWEMAREVRYFLAVDVCLAWKLNRQKRCLRLAAWAGETDVALLETLQFDLENMLQKQWLHKKEPVCFTNIQATEAIDPPYRHEAVRQGWISLICIPLFYQEQLIGLLDCFTRQTHSCEADTQQKTIKAFLQAYAHQSAAAVRNAESTKQLHTLNEITKLLTGTYEEKAIIRQILAKGLELVGSDVGWIYAMNHQENKLVLEAWQGIADELVEKERALGEVSSGGITGYVAQKGEVLNIPHVQENPHHKPIPGLDVQSEIALPLRRGEKIIGILTVKSLLRNAFTDDDENILTALAAQAAVVIERARLTTHLQQISQLALVEDTAQLFQYVVMAVSDLTGAEAAFWMLSEREAEGDTYLRIKAYSPGIPAAYAQNAYLRTNPGQSIHALSWERRQPIVKDDIFDNREPVFQNLVDAQKYGWRSFMVVPLFGQDEERLGTLSLYGQSVGQFKQLEIEAMQSFANQVAIAIQQQKRTSALRQLAQVSRIITEGITDHPKKLLEKVADLARSLTKADCVVIYPYDPNKKRFYDVDTIAAVGLQGRLLFVTNKPRKSGFAAFIRGEKAVVVHDVDAGKIELSLKGNEQSDPQAIETVRSILADANFIKRENIKAFVGVPLRARGKEGNEAGETLEVGILYINFRAPHYFSLEERQIIAIYAHHVANVVWSARLYTAEQRQTDELEAVRQTALKILGQEDLDALLKALVQEATRLLKGKGGKVYIRVPGKEQLRLLAAENVDHKVQPIGYTINIGDGLAGRVMQMKKPQIVPDYSQWEYRLQALTHLFGAVIGVPLLRGEEVIGVLAVFDEASKRQFSEDDFPILERLAQQAALAIHSATLIEQERALRKQAETLQKVSGAISANLDLHEVTSRILDELGQVIPYDKSTIQLIQGDSRELLAHRGFTVDQIDHWLLRPISQDMLVHWIVSSKELLILSNLPEDAPDEWEIRKETADIRSWVGLPLLFGNDAIGFMTLDCHKPGFYTQDHKNLLTLFANQAAVAIQNAHLYENAQRRIRDLEIVGEIARVIGAKLEINELLRDIVSQIAGHLECTHCTIFVPEYENGQKLLVPKATHGLDSEKIMSRRFTPGIGVAGWVYSRGESVLLNNAIADDRFTPSRQNESLPRSLLVVPIKSEGKTIGVLSADQDKLDWFDERDQQLLETLVHHAAIAIQNANFLRQERAIREVASAISANLQMGEVTERILDALYKVIEYHNAGIQLIEGGLRRQIAFRSHIGKEPDPYIIRPIHEDPLILPVLTSQKPLILSDSGRDPRFGQVGTHHINSWACIPLIYGLETVGTMTLDHQQAGFYSEDMKNILSLFADQSAIAIQNVLYFEKLQQPVAELQRSRDAQIAAVGEIARSIAGRADLQTVLNAIADSTVSLIRGVRLVEIHLLDKKADELDLKASRGDVINKEFRRMSTNVGITGWVVRHKKSQIVSDVFEDSRYVEILKATRSEMVIPLLQGGQALGVLNIEHPQVNAFSDKDQQLGEAIAGLITVAMQNANQFQQLEESAKRLALLQEITSVISAGPSSLNEVLVLIVENLCRIFSEAYCVIRLYDATSNVFDKPITAAFDERMRSIKDYHPRRDGISQQVVETGEPYFIENAMVMPPDSKPNMSEGLLKQGLKSSASLPLLIENQVIGILYVNLKTAHQFSQNDRQILFLFANQAATAVWNTQQMNRRIEAIRAKFNPYVVGAPIQKTEDFFGRKELLEEVLSSIHNNHFLIYGERRIGKTSLLIQLAHLLKNIVDVTFCFVPVVSSLEGVNEDQFFNFLMSHIVRSTLVSREDLQLKSEIDYDNYHFEEDFEKVLKHLQETIPDKDIRIILLLDEMDQFENYPYLLQQQFRSLFTTPSSIHLRMIMSGVHIRRMHHTPTSPWYNLFKEIELRHFEESEARQLLIESVRGYYTYEPEALLSILAYSDLKPLEVQRLGYFAVNSMLDRVDKSPNDVDMGKVIHKPLLISKDDVLRGVNLTLKEKDSAYQAVWGNFSDEQRKILLKAANQNGLIDITVARFNGHLLFNRGDLHNISRVDRDHEGFIKLTYLFMKWIRRHQ